jgi:hypothetical protein
VVLAALDAKDARAEADETSTATHHVVAFIYAGARVRLILNVPSLLPKAIEAAQARPCIYWAPWGRHAT